MRILFLGAGGVGGYFGGRLMEAGANVSFLVRPRRQAQLMENWLRVESPHGNIRVPAQTVTTARKHYDLVVLACKAWDLDAAIASVTPAMGPDSILMPLLNGMRHMDVLDQAFGRERVLGGLCHLPITMDEQGVIRHLSTIHKLVFGARHPGQEALATALADAFRPTRVDWQLSHDIMQDLWEKYFFLATLAGATCLMRGTVGAINRQPGGTEFMRVLLAECAAVATAEGFAPRPLLLAEYGAQVVDTGSSLNASMARDVARRSRTEAEHILGDLAGRARARGVATPLLDLALLHLRVHEEAVAG